MDVLTGNADEDREALCVDTIEEEVEDSISDDKTAPVGGNEERLLPIGGGVLDSSRTMHGSVDSRGRRNAVADSG